TANQCLWRGENRVAIPPKVYDVLRYLVENPSRLVSQDEILEKLWPETYVNPKVIRKYILEIRKILGDRLDKPEFIETVPKQGYRFVAAVQDENSAGPTASSLSLTEDKTGGDTAPSQQETSSGAGWFWNLAA